MTIRVANQRLSSGSFRAQRSRAAEFGAAEPRALLQRSREDRRRNRANRIPRGRAARTSALRDLSFVSISYYQFTRSLEMRFNERGGEATRAQAEGRGRERRGRRKSEEWIRSRVRARSCSLPGRRSGSVSIREADATISRQGGRERGIDRDF